MLTEESRPGEHTCEFCGKPVSPDNEDTYREVTSWVSGPKLHSPKLREQTGRLAHKACVMNVVNGQAPDEGVLL